MMGTKFACCLIRSSDRTSPISFVYNVSSIISTDHFSCPSLVIFARTRRRFDGYPPSLESSLSSRVPRSFWIALSFLSFFLSFFLSVYLSSFSFIHSRGKLKGTVLPIDSSKRNPILDRRRVSSYPRSIRTSSCIGLILTCPRLASVHRQSCPAIDITTHARVSSSTILFLYFYVFQFVYVIVSLPLSLSASSYHLSFFPFYQCCHSTISSSIVLIADIISQFRFLGSPFSSTSSFELILPHGYSYLVRVRVT